MAIIQVWADPQPQFRTRFQKGQGRQGYDLSSGLEGLLVLKTKLFRLGW